MTTTAARLQVGNIIDFDIKVGTKNYPLSGLHTVQQINRYRNGYQISFADGQTLGCGATNKFEVVA